MISKKRLRRLFLSLIVIGLILVAMLSVYFLIERNKTVQLPKPVGAFVVGRVELDLVDDSLNEAYHEIKGNECLIIKC